MITKVQYSPNFGTAKDMGTRVVVTRRAKKFLERIGQEAVDAADTFAKENKIHDPNEGKSLWQVLTHKRTPEEKDTSYYANYIKIGIRRAEESSSGRPTLAMKYSRNLSGNVLGESTRELDLTSNIALFKDRQHVMLETLRDAKDDAEKVANTAHDAWAIGSETFRRESK